jgi:hypothetical protein
MAETARFCPIRSAVCITGFVLACLFAAKPAPAVEAATCRELERKFDLIKADIVSVQRNSALFAAADQTVRDKSGNTALDLAGDESVRRTLANR